MRIAFVSNYLNRHQIPFCEAIYGKLNGQFRFIQTENMEQERLELGWGLDKKYPYVLSFHDQKTEAAEWISNSDVVLIGGTSDEYIADRLSNKRIVLRIEETIFKEGWKSVFNIRKWYMIWKCHYYYRKAPVYMLCASGNLEKELRILGLYNNKKYPWGYFPKTEQYDLDELFQRKEEYYDSQKRMEIVWCARMIWWKHPEYVVVLARMWQEHNLPIHVTMIGDGVKKKEIQNLVSKYNLDKYVTILGAVPQNDVRLYMERASVFLGTSGREEGWGAVLNEAMNSACIAVVNKFMGAAPYLIKNGINGYTYKSIHECERILEGICMQTKNRERIDLGKQAYATITEKWNAEQAANWLVNKCKELIDEAGSK